MIKELVKKLKSLNPDLSFEVSDYDPRTTQPWINVKGVSVPMPGFLNLPLGITWKDSNTLVYNHRNFRLIPLPY